MRELAKTYAEGAAKYGELNYLVNRPDDKFVKDVYNHLDEHLQRARIFLFNTDSPLRKQLLDEEPDFDPYLELGHAAWGIATLMVYHSLGYTAAAKAEHDAKVAQEAALELARIQDVQDHIDDDRDVLISEVAITNPKALDTDSLAQPNPNPYAPSIATNHTLLEHPAITRAKQLLGIGG